MARVLIVYGTTDGQTAKIARFLGDAFRARGVTAEVTEARVGSPDPEAYDGVIVAASIHARGYQRPVMRWVREHLAGLRRRPAAFLSVCLAALEKTDKARRELEAIQHRFSGQTGWVPPVVEFVPGALLYTKYGWLKRMIMRRIVRKAGGDTDTSRDYEYTDWGSLKAFVDRFIATISAGALQNAGGRSAA
jgi:menaquinone-dependent protoporphyrinogen oxidase